MRLLNLALHQGQVGKKHALNVVSDFLILNWSY